MTTAEQVDKAFGTGSTVTFREGTLPFHTCGYRDALIELVPLAQQQWRNLCALAAGNEKGEKQLAEHPLGAFLAKLEEGAGDE